MSMTPIEKQIQALNTLVVVLYPIYRKNGRDSKGCHNDIAMDAKLKNPCFFFEKQGEHIGLANRLSA